MGTKAVPAKPSELIILAINNLEEKNGSSPHDIVKFIAQEYRMKPEEVTPRVQEALKRAVTYGILVQKEGRFRIQDVPTDAAAKSGTGPAATTATSESIASSDKPGPEKDQLNTDRPKVGGQRGKRKGPVKKAAKKKKVTVKAAKEVKTRRRTKKVCKRCQKAKYITNQ